MPASIARPGATPAAIALKKITAAIPGGRVNTTVVGLLGAILGLAFMPRNNSEKPSRAFEQEFVVA